MPEIKWVGSPNFYKGRQGYKVFAIVDHIMCGSIGGTDSWFQNPSSQVSAHYGIGKDGSIHQYVKDEDTAWAVGKVNKPNWPLLSQTGGHPNMSTISIEHEGNPQDGLTDLQYQSTLWLHKYLLDKHPDIKLDHDHLIGHDRLDTVNRAACPGPKFPWDKLFKDLSPLPVDFNNGYDGFNDDVLWGLRNGLLHTYGDNTVKRYDPISREQTVNMLHQFYIKLQKGELK